MRISEDMVICSARGFCTSTTHKGNILALAVKNECSIIAVHCEENDGLVKVSDTPEIYPPEAFAEDFVAGDDIAKIYVTMDARVCSSINPTKIINSNVLFSGQPVIHPFYEQ